MGAERKILKKFDTDGNGRLEGDERDAARKELKEAPQRGGRGGGRGMPAGPAGPGGPRSEPKPGPKVSPADVANFPDAPLFAPEAVRTVFLEFDVPNWEEELELFHNTDADVPATMTVDGRRYEGVGVHFRGASSYMMVPRGSKRSFNIAVDHTDGDARLYGQNTLNLLNANGDASMMSSVLYAHLAAPHIPAPRANFVQVVVNGESWGVFVNVEQFNKAFLRERWPGFKGEGARWKAAGSPQGDGGLDYRGEDLEVYRARFEIKSKDREEDWAALVDLCEKLSTVPVERLEATLRPILDIEGALWFLALDVATANSDGYWTRASDYSIYRDPKGVFHLLPHDMNEAFKQSRGGPGGGRGGPMTDLDPLVGMDDLSKPLRSRLLAVPALRERYLDMVRQLGAEMSWERMGPVVAAQRAAIAEFVRKDTRKPFTTEVWERDTSPEPFGALRAFFERRAKYLSSYEDRAGGRPRAEEP
ncbi:MAG: CotH kinase family protein [Planctomycetota bacterium]